MLNQSESCVVDPLAKCNNATLPVDDATCNATTVQQQDLIALSIGVLERNQRNQQCNSDATGQLYGNATLKNSAEFSLNAESCGVAFSRGSNSATQELRKLIEQVSINYGGDDSSFLNEYIDDVIREWSHDLQRAVACFRDLVKQKPFNKWK